MPEPRTYVIGLPVIVTVSDDGTVSTEADMSEASSELWEGVPTDDAMRPLYTDDTVERDRAIIDAWLTRQTWEQVTAPFNGRPTAVEALCLSCGETFNPAGPDDLIHLTRGDGAECGGRGVITGAF